MNASETNRKAERKEEKGKFRAGPHDCVDTELIRTEMSPLFKWADERELIRLLVCRCKTRNRTLIVLDSLSLAPKIPDLSAAAAATKHVY